MYFTFLRELPLLKSPISSTAYQEEEGVSHVDSRINF